MSRLLEAFLLLFQPMPSHATVPCQPLPNPLCLTYQLICKNSIGDSSYADNWNVDRLLISLA